ncbi:MAG: hypothetical protein F6K00_15115 [Leptolyngbya sp. SIOISBB]|nr:hypothetical protein [Leptolyngbya sp. SIOISBB]
MSQWWIDKPCLLGIHNPTNRELEQLYSEGFSVLVSFLQAAEQRPCYDIPHIEAWGYKRYTIPVKDFAPPTLAQLEQFINLVNQTLPDAKMIIHCGGGSGRTGTFAAAYWVAKGMTAADAIKLVRQAQPHAVETIEQQGAVASYEKQLQF